MPTPASGANPDLEVRPFPIERAEALSRGLDLPWPVASILARRGFEDPDSASLFLEGRVSHPASEFDGIGEVAALILRAVEEGKAITIYGDYDCDGVCATSILVELLRDLEGRCDWFIPDRMTEGYGLNRDAIESLAARGTELIVTVDCGISSPDEVALARELGMEIVVTDHHRFGELLPDCPILHPEVSGYPFHELCGAGVAWKLATEIRRASGRSVEENDRDLDLVALATVADVMPLVDENRSLVEAGLGEIRRATRPGMRALLEASSVEPTTVRAVDLGFRLGPRVNAVGRIYRADAGVELFLTGDPARAGEIGSELSRANSERRRIEREVEQEAKASIAESGGEEPSALVAAGEGWHPGVLGIVAARISRERRVPTVVLGIEDGVARGSARSLPGVDLHGSLSEVSDLLLRYGGHQAAAGLSLEADRVDEFREAFDEVVSSRTGGGPIPERLHVDCFLGGEDLDIQMAEAVEALEPFGSGNPAPRVLIPSARVVDSKPLSEGKHSRLTVASGGRRCSAIAFGRDGSEFRPELEFDLVGSFGVNHWKGSSEPQFNLEHARPRPDSPVANLPTAEDGEWWERFEARVAGEAVEKEPIDGSGPELPEVAGRHGSGPAGIASLSSSGESVLVITAEAFRRWQGLGGAEAIARFTPDGTGAEDVVGTWAGSPETALSTLTGNRPRVMLSDYEALGSLAGSGHQIPFGAILLLDPPAGRWQRSLPGLFGNVIHLVSDPTCVDFALAASAERHDPVPALREAFVVLRDGGPVEGSGVRRLLEGPEATPRSPERAAILLRIMVEAGIARSSGFGPDRKVEVVSSDGISLDDSDEYRRQSGIHKEQIASLRRSDSLISKQ